MASTVALMPLKAHSERVPGKNFRDLAGKPLFRWMLDTLLSVEAIDAVVINTDARALLLEHGLREGPRVVLRDRAPELCGDMVSMNRVLADDVGATDAERYLMTHVTNPLLGAQTIREALSRFEASDHDSLFSVTRVQTRFYRADLSPVNHDPALLQRTQDLEPWFEENSCLYVFGRESFLASGARIGARPMMFETPRLESIDIDEPAD
ncbi:MAG: acylneuraminate cytidylyltransferase family protein, partial [Gemmatimonadota bacterium]|nr:acylneuraminate cytidylyltransferase family protein [Gemmatimonadota bacterium]